MYARYLRRPVLFALWIVLVAALPAPAGELWLASTRHLPPVCCDQPSLQLWRFGPDHCWVSSSTEEFLATADPAVPVTFFIHGNRADADRAIQTGWNVYQRMTCDAGDRPFRLVIWSWPSDQIRGPRRDAQSKACRSDFDAYFLATFLNRLPLKARVNLFGFSFGARIATGALELLAGGQVACCSLGNRNPSPRLPMRAMLVAGAIDSDWLFPGHYHGLATGLLEQLLVTRNGCDRALRLYPRMDRNGAEALGFVGPCCGSANGDCPKFDVADVSCSVGREHSWENYWCAGDIQSRLAWYSFLAESPATPPPALAAED